MFFSSVMATKWIGEIHQLWYPQRDVGRRHSTVTANHILSGERWNYFIQDMIYMCCWNCNWSRHEIVGFGSLNHCIWISKVYFEKKKNHFHLFKLSLNWVTTRSFSLRYFTTPTKNCLRQTINHVVSNIKQALLQLCCTIENRLRITPLYYDHSYFNIEINQLLYYDHFTMILWPLKYDVTTILIFNNFKYQ